MIIIKIIRKAYNLLHFLMRRAAFIVMDYVLPVNSNYWVFCTWDRHPHTLDNPRALFEEVKNDPEILKIILQKKSVGELFDDGVNVKFIEAESFAADYYLARSKIIIIGIALGGLSSNSVYLRPRHYIIQLWHGIPLKRIAKFFPNETWWDRETYKYKLVVSSSDADRKTMAQAFAPIPIENVLQTGLPRNDLILKKDAELPLDLFNPIIELRNKLAGKRLILYAPTWRENELDLYDFSAKERERLKNLLTSHNAYLGIRGHSNVMHSSVYSSDLDDSSIGLLNHIPDVNILFRDVDLLITDYSSIYIDFLLTNKPIIHFVYDLEEYVKERGFLYDLDEAFAGPVVKTFDKLIDSIDSALKNGTSDVEKYNNSARLFHQHDDRPSQAVAQKITMLLES